MTMIYTSRDSIPAPDSPAPATRTAVPDAAWPLLGPGIRHVLPLDSMLGVPGDPVRNLPAGWHRPPSAYAPTALTLFAPFQPTAPNLDGAARRELMLPLGLFADVLAANVVDAGHGRILMVVLVLAVAGVPAFCRVWRRSGHLAGFVRRPDRARRDDCASLLRVSGAML